MKRSQWFLSLFSLCIVSVIIAQTHIYNANTINKTNAYTAMSLSSIAADIDGDGLNDEISVHGGNTSGKDIHPEYANISVVFSSTGYIKRSSSIPLSGNSFEVKAFDFTNDGKNEVAIFTYKDNTVGLHIIDFSANIPKIIFSDAYNSGIQMDMRYSDDFKIIASVNNGENFSVNLTKQAEKLISCGIYSEDGTLTSTASPKLSEYTKITPLRKSDDYGYFLVAKQEIYDEKAFVLCDVISHLCYDDNRWVIKKIEYSYPQSDVPL